MMPVASESPLTHVQRCEMRPLLVAFSAPLPRGLLLRWPDDRPPVRAWKASL